MLVDNARGRRQSRLCELCLDLARAPYRGYQDFGGRIALAQLWLSCQIGARVCYAQGTMAECPSLDSASDSALKRGL
jgi:hypothetical protein